MTVAALPKATRRGLATEAADLVRAAIFAGRFPPGSPLREVELAEELGISRGPLREGLAQLEQEGLVRGGWHRRTAVIEITPRDVREVYELRAALDRLAATTALHEATGVGLDRLDALVGELAALVRDGADEVELASADLAFHEQIYQMAGNERLTCAWNSIRYQIHLFHITRITRAADDFRARVVQEHQTLAELLRGGREDALAACAQEHVESARRALLATMTPES